MAQKPHYLVIASHLGRPDGKVKEGLSLKNVCSVLSSLLKTTVVFKPEITPIEGNGIFLLENLRFHPEEEGLGGDVERFKGALTNLCDVYVNDAFGTLHRPHTSIVGVEAKSKVAGFLVQREIEALSNIIDNQLDTLIIGGAKISDKALLLQNLLKSNLRHILIGGAMANTFHLMNGEHIGKSKAEGGLETERTVREIYRLAESNGTKIVLPKDFVACKGDGAVNCRLGQIEDDWSCMDIGPQACSTFGEIIGGSKKVFMNGPMGVFEDARFANGTKSVFTSLEQLCSDKRGSDKGFVVIGGGETASAARSLGYENKFSHCSTGGGASLEFLEGKTLPGISFLDHR